MTFPADDLEPWFPIETERLMLREARPEDFDDIHAYAVRDDVVRFMIWGPNTAEETRTVLDSWLDEQALWPRPGVSLVIEEMATERVVGSIRLTIQDAVNRTADMGYTLHS
ncbi:MAG TPA: GNAT family N-acetyltransferase, partial [Phenylobacterium sp.]|nr:GNAT family N-acetyltransferase [Phenylobacterium sp.]